MDTPKPALVILAAGESRRLGEPKALARLRDSPPRTALELLLRAGAGLDEVPPLVVTGAHHAEIAAARTPGCELLENPDWSAGRTGGVRLAARARPGRDLLIAPVDCPLVTREVFDLLTAVWRRSLAPPRGWLAPRRGATHGRRFGHPVIVGRELLSDLEDLSDGEPLSALRSRAAPLFAVDVADPGILDDLDTPEDLARMRGRISDQFSGL